MISSVKLPVPGGGNSVTADMVASGLPIPPIERIRIFSASQWEEFVLEWADSLINQYSLVELCGGAGDMGRDIIAFDKADASIWDNYQCKHYQSGLTPSDIWVEIGKLVYYTHVGEYTYPRKYFFVAPQGAGTKLSNLLRQAKGLKDGLIQNWDKHCRKNITSTAIIDLDTALLAHLDKLDFSIFEAVPPLRIIDQHAQTRWYAARFGGGLPGRAKREEPPLAISPNEMTYVRGLLDAYSDHLKCIVQGVEELESNNDLKSHFNDARLEFYSAEALRVFSRDTLPLGAFEELQDELHGGVKDEVRGAHQDGYYRVLSVVKTAKLLPITAHALKERLSSYDRGGICHQLVNDGKFRWVK